LGITHAAAANRPPKLFNSRFNKAKTRMLRISRLARVSKHSRKLFYGSGFSAQTWGHQACAFSPSQLLSLERSALACAGIKAEGRCRTVALATAYAVLGPHRARIVRQTLRAWFSIVRTLSETQINDLRAAWSRARDALVDNDSMHQVYGLMSNVIFMLNQAQWAPRAYNVWQDHEGSTWAMTEHSFSPGIVAAITKAFLLLDCARFKNHPNGKGIKDGFDYHNTMSVYRNISFSSYRYKCTLEAITCGTIWTAGRIHAIHPPFPPHCSRCGGMHVETDVHRYWLCPANDHILDEGVQNTQDLRNNIEEKSADIPCL